MLMWKSAIGAVEKLEKLDTKEAAADTELQKASPALLV